MTVVLVGVSAVQVDHTDVLMGVSAPLVGVFPVIVTDRSLVYLDPTVGEVQKSSEGERVTPKATFGGGGREIGGNWLICPCLTVEGNRFQ